jgi:hypothetical protein
MKSEINRTTGAMPQEKWEHMIKTKSNIMTRIIYFLILTLVCSCSNNYNQGRAINTEKLVIPDSLLSFFPENEDIQLIMYSTNAERMDLPYIPATFSITYYMEMFSCTDKSFKKLVDKCMKDTIISYDANGNNFFIVEKERYLLKKYGIDTLKNLYYKNSIDNLSFSLHSALRIENFEYYDSESLTGLTNDFQILIIKRGNNFVLFDDSYKYEWEVLSNKNKHGYIGGIAFNKKDNIIIYYIVVW